MKKDIQPQVYIDTAVTCACGNTFVTQSTKQAISVEICSACHPFYTGTQKFVDTEGRIDKFAKKRKLAEEKQNEIASRKSKSTGKTSDGTNQPEERQSLKDLLKSSKQ